MLTIQIKTRYTSSVLFECEVPDTLDSGLHMRHALEKATIAKASLIGANLAGASLIGANLAGANLIGANLIGASLIDANLIGANLRDANLIGANLGGANLGGANLRDANLGGANLGGANLGGANLRDANLRDASLIGANLAGANLAGKKLIGDRPFFTIGPIGSRSDYLQAFLTDAGLMIRTGCFFGAKTEFEEKLSEKHGGNDHAQEYRAALVLIGKHAELWTPAGQFIAQEEFPANL